MAGRAWRPSVALLLVILFPGGIVDTIGGALSHLVTRPLEWAREALRRAIDWVMEGIGNVMSWVAGALDGIWEAVRGVQDFANGIYHRVEGLATSVWERLTGWMADRIEDLRGLVGGVRDGILRWVGDRIEDLRNLVGDLRNWVRDHVWQPLWEKAEGLGKWIEGTVRPWVAGLVDGVRDWAGQMFDWVVQHALDLIRPWIDWAQRLLGAVDKAFDWLVWLARYPYSWFTESWRSLMHRAPKEIVAGVLSVVAKEGPVMEDYLVRWLG